VTATTPLATCPNLPKYCWAASTMRCPRLPIAGLIQDEHPGWVGPQIRVRLPQFQALAIDRLGIPRSIMQEVMQPLALGPRKESRQLDQRQVRFTRQQESNELVAEGLPLLPSSEQHIEAGTKLINCLGGWRRRLARSGHQNISSLEENARL
jgi:hypothetical protein